MKWQSEWVLAVPLRWVNAGTPAVAGAHPAAALSLQLAKCKGFQYTTGVRIFLKGAIIVLLITASGCANYSPFVKGSRVQTIWGYPPELIGNMLNIPETDRSRLEDFAPDSTPGSIGY